MTLVSHLVLRHYGGPSVVIMDGPGHFFLRHPRLPRHCLVCMASLCLTPCCVTTGFLDRGVPGVLPTSWANHEEIPSKVLSHELRVLQESG